MSAELQPEQRIGYVSYADYADASWYDELVRMQNSDTWPDAPLFLHASFQKLCAESLIEQLKDKPYFQKFGGKALQIIMVPTGEPYMFSVGMEITDPAQ